MGTQIKCPVCPVCGEQAIAEVSLSQVFCGNNDCPVLIWDATVSAAQNLSRMHHAEIIRD